MMKSNFYYKELTSAEVGTAGTHEVYIRMPNGFDYETFFGNAAVQNGSVKEVNFQAIDITNGGNDIVPLRFVYFENSNKEKRIPSLAPLFRKNNVTEGDIVCLESRQDGNTLSYYIRFYKKGEIQISPASIYFMQNDNDLNRINRLPQVNLDNSNYLPFLAALRTKPFLLLAGISGTGKSRIVREFAFKSCPKYLQDEDHTTPGNYCMIEVKPNWHDSTELLGYYSNLNECYQFKKFVKFLVKAKMFPDVPFFVCLDEMNLAPVEHYFAEILSILETRKHRDNDIKTDVIVDKTYFKNFTRVDENGATHAKFDMTDKDWYEAFFGIPENEDAKRLIRNFQYKKTLQETGLTLPGNVLIIGTVNMDDTTHQFSRKVIDRVMTIEMNGGKLADMFGGSKDLDYLPDADQDKWQKAFLQPYINADEVLEAHPDEAEEIKQKLPEKLEQINEVLKNTPFTVSYRVLNELVIMTGVLLDYKKDDDTLDSIINQAFDNIMLMKILPRIEGDEEMFTVKGNPKNRLEQLMDLMPDITTTDNRQTAKDKIKEMNDRLNAQGFTRFWP